MAGSIFSNTKLLAGIEAELLSAPKQRTGPLELQRARQVLNIGRTEEAVALLEVQRERLAKSTHPTAPATLEEIESLLAIAWLRLGEQENCLARHGPESCIAPFSEAAHHQVPRGAQKAFELLSEILDKRPQDTGSR
ncbi:MAG: hypothetical protein EXS13_10495 [Planctomycetes bacterium]|nr:hypothetical protein [Planctomycetota bacterium]